MTKQFIQLLQFGKGAEGQITLLGGPDAGRRLPTPSLVSKKI